MEDGDGFSEPYLWEKGATDGAKLGGRHLNSEHDFEYGSRVGCWRIFRLMEEFGWKMTLWAIAKAMERNPAFAKACVREGHEIGAHGEKLKYMHDKEDCFCDWDLFKTS